MKTIKRLQFFKLPEQVNVLFTLMIITGSISAEIKHVHTTFTSNPTTSITVSWRTDLSSTVSEVLYGTTTSYGQTATGNETIISQGGLEHHITLTGLTPGTWYHYKCGGGSEWSEDCTFKTAPDQNEDFYFVAPGDVQVNGNNKNWNKEAVFFRDLNAELPAFWIPLGDQVSRGESQNHWDGFFASVMADISIISPLIGNHELRDLEGNDGYFPQNYIDMFKLPTNGHGAAYEDYFYSFTYSNALFVVLGWNEKDFWPDCYNIQKTWMDSVLTNTTQKWKLVFLHPPIYNSKKLDAPWAVNQYPEWNQVWEDNNVNAVFSGDMHIFEICLPIKNDTTVPTYEEGTLYYNAPNLTGIKVAQGAWWTRTVASGDSTEFLTPLVKVTEDSVVVETWDWNNEILFDVLSFRDNDGTVEIQSKSEKSVQQDVLSIKRIKGSIIVAISECRDYSFQLITLNGKIINEQKGTGKASYRYSSDDLCPGMYLLRAVVEENLITGKCIVVK